MYTSRARPLALGSTAAVFVVVDVDVDVDVAVWLCAP
jgi:hypothetical protein